MTRPLRVGALFAGYGGLELAVTTAIPNAQLAWVSEIEPAPSRILAHHWPDVPNHGDVTKIRWEDVEPVDIITGGSPCQDVSSAGKRRGMRPGTRSGLWASMCDAIDIIRPRLVVWENVQGVLSASAESEVEPCPICVGNDGGPHLRALGRVVGDLAELGYDAAWCGLRAADVGAPHGRYRVFVVAWPAREPTSAHHPPPRDTQGVQRERDITSGDRRRRPQTPPRDTGGATADPNIPARGERWVAAPRQEESRGTRPDPRRRSGTPPPDTNGPGREGCEPAGRRLVPARGSTPDTTSDGRDERWTQPTRDIRGPHAPLSGTPAAPDPQGWGAYTPAIRRWETILGRPAPPPTEPNGRNNAHRLSPAFVEWMMGLPAGWVTDVPGTTRNDQLKALGNGVVPQQAAAAITHLLTQAPQGVE